MAETFTWGELDRDGALEEAASNVDSRAQFLRRAAVGGGVFLGSGALLGTLAESAQGATPASDVAILNFALTLEFLEAEFYTRASRSGGLRGRSAQFSRVVGAHERAHVAFLRKALGSAAVKKPKFDFKGTTDRVGPFVNTAIVLEDAGVAAYAGQGPLLKTKAIVSAALSIHSVEARHAAWIRDIKGNGGAPSPAPAAFDKAATKAQILAAVKGTGFIVG